MSGDTALLGWGKESQGRKKGRKGVGKAGIDTSLEVSVGLVEKWGEGSGELGARENYSLSLENADPGGERA